MELGEHAQSEPPVADCDCRRCAIATRDALRKDAERWREFCRQAEAGEFPIAVLYDARMMGAGVLEMRMDTAMRE
jgi:hypothetical protein